MTPAITESQMQYLRLRPNEYAMYRWLMGEAECCADGGYKFPQSEWPESLADHVNATVRRLGICGDVVSCAVADWVAGRAAPNSKPAPAEKGPTDARPKE